MVQKPITTGYLVNLLKEQDPEGKRALFFRVYDDCYETELYVAGSAPIGAGEAYKLAISKKGAYQTEDGDVDVLRLDLWMDCEVS